jgi:hypothetical protein
MSTLTYTNFTNIDASYCRPYEPGDRLVKGWEGEIHIVLDEPLLTLEHVFARHNRDDRPDGRLCPSMSVGDVVIIGEVAYSVASVGFEPVAVDPADLITDRTWTEVAR